jgi:streptomycin 6-kinase
MVGLLAIVAAHQRRLGGHTLASLQINSPDSSDLRRRLEDRVAAWAIAVGHVGETESAVLAFGRRNNQPVVLKVIRTRGHEWGSGEVLNAFEGRGVVRVLDHIDGAVLLERLRPGDSLVSMVVGGDDDRATGILTDVIGRMSPRAPSTAPTVQGWAQGSECGTAGGVNHIPTGLLEDARRVYGQLRASQSKTRLLHGDLHHCNVLRDSERGWLAIDPKGVAGELEYEVGAALRNPYERPDVFAEPATIQRRVDRFARELHLDAGRILAWAFAQAVLAVVWAIEDGFVVAPDHRWIVLAHTIRPMLKGVVDA